MVIRKLNGKEPTDGVLTIVGSDLNNASATAKGVVQVGSGLNVNNGTISVNTGAVNITSLGVDTPLADYPIGNVTRRIVPLATDPDYIILANVIKDIFRPDLLAANAGNYFRMHLTTVKTDANNGYQEVKVLTNVLNNFRHIFTLNRTQDSGNFTAWTGNIETIAGKGSPEGVVTSPISTRYMDTNNGDIYFKGGNANSIINTGWISLNKPKEYAFYSGSSPSSWVLDATNNTRLTMLSSRNRGIVNNAEKFTLKGGKVYSLDYSCAVATTATSGVIRIGIYNADTNAVADGNKITIGTGANDKSKTSASCIIAPSVDTEYYIGVEANSPAGSFLAYSQTLSIVEI